jgi:hypothetical protein
MIFYLTKFIPYKTAVIINSGIRAIFILVLYITDNPQTIIIACHIEKIERVWNKTSINSLPVFPKMWVSVKYNFISALYSARELNNKISFPDIKIIAKKDPSHVINEE